MTKKQSHELQNGNRKIMGIGVDIESVKRFRKRALNLHASFYKKIFTDKEIAYCKTYKDPYPHLAARFSAKEAAIKAFGEMIDFRRIEVRNDMQTGAPFLFLDGFRVAEMHVSLSHTKDHAIAIVVLQKQQ